MRLYQKLVLFMLVATVGPVSVIGFWLLRAAETELEVRIGAQQAAAAVAAAELAAREIDEAVESLSRSAAPIRWSELDEAERAGALRLVGQQSRRFRAALLIDGTGTDLAAPAIAEGAQAELPALRAALPVAELGAGGLGAVALSPSFALPSTRSSAAALGVSLSGPSGSPWYLGVQLSLQGLQERVEAVSAQGAGELWLLDAQGRVVAAPVSGAIGQLAPAAERNFAASAATRSAWPSVARYASSEGPVLAAAATTPGALGWTALIRLPERVAFAAVARMRRDVLLSVGGALLLLLGVGLAFTRDIARRIERVAEGARALGKGELSARIDPLGRDEMADLATAFNGMAAEIQAARRKLESWNEELQREVEQRTAELKAAQAQLLEAQKLAAIGQLGAGVAHEINNPLAGILGNTQLLLLDRPAEDRDATSLRKIEALAKRAKEITANLLRFSQQRHEPSLKAIDLNQVVAETLTLVETQVRSEGIEVKLELAAPPVAVTGDPGHLSQVLLNLIANARTAMMKSPTKVLTIATAASGGRATLSVTDTGRGIAPEVLPRIFEPFFTTKDVWSNVGLGLSVSFRIASEHGGTLRARTEVGQGSCFTLDLPQRA